MKKVIGMTEINPMQNGAEKRLYEENVTPRDSLAFDILTLLGGKAIGWIGMVADRGLDALGIGRYFRTPEKEKEQTSYQTKPIPAMASGYEMAMARQAAINPTYQSNHIKSIYRRMS